MFPASFAFVFALETRREMPPKRSKSPRTTATYLLYSKPGADGPTWRCRLNKQDHKYAPEDCATRCEHAYTSDSLNVPRAWGHMVKCHSENETVKEVLGTGPAAVPGAPRLRQQHLRFPAAAADDDDEEPLTHITRMFARRGLAFRLCDDKDWQWLLKRASLPKYSRRTISERMKAQAIVSLDGVLKNFSTPTLCVDIGTVNKRYLVFSLVERGQTAVVEVVCDSAMPDRRMTTENIIAKTKELMRVIRARGVFPLAVVADNAANIQGLRHDSADTEPQPQDPEDDYDDGFALDEESVATAEKLRLAYAGEIPHVLRCAAHVIQLIANSSNGYWGAVLDTAKAILNTVRSSRRPNDTRWSTKYVAVEDVLEKYSEHLSPSEKIQFRNTLELLRPAFLATNYIQREDATLWDAICAYSYLHDAYADRATLSQEQAVRFAAMKRQVKTRVEFVADSYYLVLSYFAPWTNRSAIRINVRAAVCDVILFVDPEAETAGYLRSVPPPARSEIPGTLAAFVEWITDALDEWPRMRDAVIRIAHICPTEASVERAFSMMKSIARHLRCRLDPASVRSMMIVSSASRFEEALAKCDADEADAIEQTAREQPAAEVQDPFDDGLPDALAAMQPPPAPLLGPAAAEAAAAAAAAEAAAAARAQQQDPPVWRATLAITDMLLVKYAVDHPAPVSGVRISNRFNVHNAVCAVCGGKLAGHRGHHNAYVFCNAKLSEGCSGNRVAVANVWCANFPLDALASTCNARVCEEAAAAGTPLGEPPVPLSWACDACKAERRQRRSQTGSQRSLSKK